MHRSGVEHLMMFLFVFIVTKLDEEDADNVVLLAMKTVTESRSNYTLLEGYFKNSCIKHSIHMDVYRKLSIGLLQKSSQSRKSLH